MPKLVGEVIGRCKYCRHLLGKGQTYKDGFVCLEVDNSLCKCGMLPDQLQDGGHRPCYPGKDINEFI